MTNRSQQSGSEGRDVFVEAVERFFNTQGGLINRVTLTNVPTDGASVFGNEIRDRAVHAVIWL